MTSTPCNLLLWSVSNSSQSPNRLRQKLEASNRSFYSNNCEGLFRALQRFTNLPEIELYDPIFGDKADVNYPIRRIASSGLDLQSLSLRRLQKPPFPKTFKKLADALPWLGELDIQLSGCRSYYQRGSDSKSAKYIVTNVGIEVISRKLPRLCKIDITEQLGCSDRSLIALSISKLDYSLPDDSFTFENSMNFAQSLRDLRIDAYEDRDRLLGSISTAGIPLGKILIYDDSGLSFNGLSNFLCACSSLKHLQLVSIKFLNDNSTRDLCRYLPNLVSIKLDFCSNITAATFFILAKECPLLSEIELQEIKLPVGDDFDMELERNYRIISLELSHIGHMNDEFLRNTEFVCSNLQTLNVTGLNRLTKEGIGDILKCCSQIKHLIVDKTRELGIFLEQFKTRYIKIEHHFFRSV